MTTFNENAFIQDIALRQSRRIGITPGDLASAFDAQQIVPNTSPARWEWPVEPGDMTSECWIIARMSADLRGLIAERQSHGAQEIVSVSHVDLLELGWTHNQIRSYSTVTLANAHASLRAEAAGLTQRQFSGFGSMAALASLVAISGASGMVLTGIATLL